MHTACRWNLEIQCNVQEAWMQHEVEQKGHPRAVAILAQALTLDIASAVSPEHSPSLDS